MRLVSIYALCVGAALLGWAGIHHTHTSYYCQQCGMKRSRDQRQWLRHPVQDTNRLYQTHYSKLYFRGISATCPHKWGFTGSRSSSGEIGCGASAYALRYAPLLRRLHNLDKSKIPALLAAMPLQPSIPKQARENIDDIYEAVAELEENPSPQQTRKWWQKHRGLFNVKQLAK